MAHGSNSRTRTNARELRKNQTPIEAILWGKLRGGQVSGFKFRRQHPISQFIVDFCCEEVHLVIELDGDSHAFQEEYDEARTNHLNSLGYKVFRVTNRDVLNYLDGVLEVILEECIGRKR